MSNRQILWACVDALVMMVAIGVFVYFNDEPVGVSVQKALMVPAFMLSIHGLRLYFPPENDATRNFTMQMEYEFLKAALIAIFVTYWIIPYSSVSLPKIILSIVLMIIVAALANIFLFWLGRRSGNHKNSPQ